MNPCKSFPMFYAIVKRDGVEVKRFGPRSTHLCEQTRRDLIKVFPESEISIEFTPVETIENK